MSKILVVEDEAQCRYLLEITLQGEGFEVESASFGDQALEKGRAFKPDVLISDWRLKDTIDGIEIAKTLQTEQQKLRVILFSGSPSDDLRAEAKAKGLNISMALEKPLGLDDVVAAVKNSLSNL